MVHIRKLYAILIAVSLASASCTPGNRRTSAPSDITLHEPTATSHTGPSDEADVPTCFSPHELLPFAFSPDNSQLAVRGSQDVQFFDLETGQEVASLTAPHAVLTAALSPDGGTLAWSLDDNSIQLVQVSDGTLRYTLNGHPDPVLDLRFSPTGTELFSTSHDGTVRVWDTQTGTPFPPIEVGLEVLGIGVSPEGETLAVVPGYGPIQVWDISTAQHISTLGGTGGYDTSDPVFSPDGQYLAVDLATGIFIWTLPDGREIWSNVANSMGVAYSPDNRYLAYTDVDESNKVFLGPADTQGDFRVIDEMRGPVWELFFSPDSSLLAATDGIEIRVWRLPEGNRIITGKPTCPEDVSSPLGPSAASRQFDPSAQYVDDVPYPQEILAFADTELVPLACTPEYFSWSGTNHEFIDPSTLERHAPTDPRIEMYLEAARQLNPGKSITSISLCESDENDPLVLFRVGPCGGGCAGTPNIARGQQDGTLTLLAIVEPDADGPYYGCSPLQLSKRGDLYLSCLGEGTALIRRASLHTGEVSIILRCDLTSLTPSCEVE